MNPRNFFAELKRRNVYKVAVAYAIVAWLLVQAGIDPLPDLRSASLGDEIFITMQDVAPNESIARTNGRKITGGIVLIALITIGPIREISVSCRS